MTRSGKLLILLLLALFTGCSTSSDVVGKGPFQKRKYRPGWDLSSFRTQHREAAPTSRIIHERVRPMTLRTVRTWPEPEHAAPLSASLSLVRNPRNHPAHHSGTVLNRKPKEYNVQQELPSASMDVLTTDTDGESTVSGDRRWNRMAIVSGVFLFLSVIAAIAPGGTAILLYFLTFAIITGIIGLVLACKNKEKGKLIAIAAIALPLLFIALLFAIEKNVF